MSTIICSECGVEIEVNTALQSQIQRQVEAQVLAEARKVHAAELAKVRTEAEAAAKAGKAAAEALARKRLDSERALLMEQAKADLDIAKRQQEAQLTTERKKQAAQHELLVKSLKDDAEAAKQGEAELRKQLAGIMQALREEKKARENAELEAQKKLAAEENKIRDEARKTADDTYRLKLAEQEKKLADTQKMLEEAQRKATQGSQQLQGEIMELDLERALTEAFRDDLVEPVAKGVRGGDIRQCVRSPRGADCGVILWELKRTKHWTDGWIPKLKEDLRNAKANVPVIVTEAMPKTVETDIGQLNGVWICKPQLAVVLSALLRKGLLDVGLQKALAQNRGDKADALYNFVTSHEFAHQIESMVETYSDMAAQISKERIAYEKIWSQRQKQVETLLLGTANIYGSMQGYIGQASMPRIKGLELLEAGDGESGSQAEATGGTSNLTLV